MKFAEFEVGRVFDAGPYTVGEQEIIVFATAFDPQWFHTDAAAAARGRFGSLIASGFHTCSIAMRLMAGAALQGSEAFASPGVEYVKWPAPVKPGDELRLRAEVLDKRLARGRPGLGLVRWHWQLFNQAGVEVLDLKTTSCFDLAPGSLEQRAC
jgi:acyl dehydratase